LSSPGSEQHAAGAQGDLFGLPLRLPAGFSYQPDFLTVEEEAGLLAHVRELPLAEAKYKAYTAKRRTVSYGASYDFDANALEAAPPIAPSLLPLREKVAHWAGVSAAAFTQALVSEYRPGTQLGWHRDVPDFEVIVGVSLLGECRMRLRPYRPGERNRREDVIALDVAPRSAYVIRDTARWGWQHSIAPTKALRYSITFRTARRRHAQAPA
jgi:alkylated DNA repair dioxygenase AlkB